MTCAFAREEVARLDRAEAPGPALAAHLRDCPACREFARRLAAIEAMACDGPSGLPGHGAEVPADPAAARFTERVMRSVAHEGEPSESSGHAPAFGSWSAGGVLIVCGMVVVQYSGVVEWLRGEIGPIIDVALGTLFGVALTVYLLFLVGSNMAHVQRLLRLRPR